MSSQKVAKKKKPTKKVEEKKEQGSKKKKAAVKKTPSKKTPAKKTPAKKTPAKKAAAKKPAKKEVKGKKHAAGKSDAKTKKAPTKKKTVEAEEKKKEPVGEVKVGDKVRIKANRVGVVRWTGEDKAFGVGVYYGIQLTEPRGDCNGEWKDKKHFKCPDKHGTYVQKRFIEEVLAAESEAANFEVEDMEAEVKENPAIVEARERRAKIRALKQRFKEADDDGSLTLEKPEFVKMAMEALESTELEALQLFADVDASGNGSVSFAEFDAWLRVGGGIDKLNTYKDLKQKFKDADNDGSLELDEKEFCEMAQESMQMSTEDAKELFKRVDANGNGSISFAEFEAWIDDLGGIGNMQQYAQLKEAFKAADADGSGELSLEEFKALAKDKLGWNVHKCAQVFEKIDLSGDGSIQYKEFEAWVDKIGGYKKVKKDDNAEEAKQQDEEPVEEQQEPDAEAEIAQGGDEDVPEEDDAEQAQAPEEEEEEEKGDE